MTNPKPTDPSIGEAVERVTAAAAKRRAGARREAQDLGRRVGVDKYEAWTMETATTTVGSLDLEALLSENAQLRERVEVLEGAISWALGEGDSDFGDRETGNGPRYWWRKELRARSSRQALDTTP